MTRWITFLAVVAVLSGCVTTREVVYREPYQAAPSGQYVGGGSYYEQGYAGSGDYYYGSAGHGGYGGYGAYDVSSGIGYFDYPLYYSLFWPINRWYYDPFVHPGYYYGVTWFPRSYFSLSASYGGGWRSHGWLSYSPYRYSSVDNYYDWRPWYNRYPSYRSHYPQPRYGDARVEAQRLADLRRPTRAQPYAHGQYRPGRQSGHRTDTSTAPAYRGNRAADYGNAAARPRQGSSLGRVPMQSGPGARQEVRRVGAGVPRVAPQTGVFGNPARASSPTSGMAPRGASGGNSGMAGAGRGEIQRVTQQRDVRPVSSPRSSDGQKPVTDRSGTALPVRNTRPATVDRGIPVQGVRSAQPVMRPPASLPSRTPSMPQQATPVRSNAPVRTVAPAVRGYSSGQTTPVPAVRSEVPAVRIPAQRAPTSAPARSAVPARGAVAPEPAPRSAPVQSRDSGSRSSDSGGVRRTGSDRER